MCDASSFALSTSLAVCSAFRVQGSGFRVQGSGCRVQGAGFRVQGSGFRVGPVAEQLAGGLQTTGVQGLGYRVEGVETSVEGVPGCRVQSAGCSLHPAPWYTLNTRLHTPNPKP